MQHNDTKELVKQPDNYPERVSSSWELVIQETIVNHFTLGRIIMCRKLIYLVSLVSMLGVAGSASAELVAYWAFK